MNDPKDSITFEIHGFKASAVGRFAVASLLIFAAVLIVLAALYGPTKVVEIWRGPANVNEAKYQNVADWFSITNPMTWKIAEDL